MTESVDKTLRDLFAQPLMIIINGEELALTPFRADAIPKVLQLSKPFAGDLVQMYKTGIIEIHVINLLADHGERVFDLAAILACKPREWVGRLPPDELLKLLIVLFEVNADFFSQRLLPALKSAWSRISGRLSNLPKTVAAPSAGPTSSSG